MVDLIIMGNLSDITRYDYVVVDGMNYAYRCHNGIPVSFQGKPTGMLLGMARFVMKYGFYGKQFKGAKVIFLWEGMHQWRKKKYPYYKANRKSSGDSSKVEFFDLLNECQGFLQSTGVYQVSHDGLEADELASWFAKKYKNVLLVSNDKDWQVLAGYADILREDTILKYADVEKKWGFKPEYIYWYLTIHGDSGDNVPNALSGLYKKHFPVLLSLIKSVEDIPDALSAMGLPQWALKAEKSLPVLRENADIVMLHDEMVKKFIHTPPKIDLRYALDILDNNGMDGQVSEYANLSYKYSRGKNEK